jgi:hypothetical protein
MQADSGQVETSGDIEKATNKKSWFAFQFLNACAFASALQKTGLITYLRPPTAQDNATEYAINYGFVPSVIFLTIAFFLFNRLEGWINSKIRPGKRRTATKFLFTLTFCIGITALGVVIALMVRYAKTGR